MDGWVIDIAKQAAVAGLLFVVWYVYHRSQVQIMEQYFQLQRQFNERLVRSLQSVSEAIEMAVAMLHRMETKIDTGQTCHITKYREQ